MNYADRIKLLEQTGSMNFVAVPRDILSKKTRARIKIMGILLDNQAKRCVYCGSRERLTIDHYIPRSRGGTNDLVNLVLACMDCNNEKGSDLPLNFIWRRIKNELQIS